MLSELIPGLIEDVVAVTGWPDAVASIAAFVAAGSEFS
jgi:hypothetical protein